MLFGAPRSGLKRPAHPAVAVRMKRTRRIGLVALGSILVLAGCGSESSDPATQEAEGPTESLASALGGPVVSAITPGSGIAGDTVTITGSSFGHARGTSSVMFRGNPASVVSWSDTKIVCTVTAAATAGDLNVWVVVDGMASKSVPFALHPSIQGVAPGIVEPGQEITIAGSNMSTTQRSSTVSIGGVLAAVTSWSNRQVKALVPIGASGPLDVVVTVNGKASAPKTITTAEEATPDTSTHLAGREVMYKWVDKGSVSDAASILANTWPVDRFADASLPEELTWTEDPYEDPYWRSQFYGFRPVRHLLAAYRATNDARYLDKLLSIVRSFASTGASAPFSRDRLATATRALVLVNVHW
jgi:hypothetical protein